MSNKYIPPNKRDTNTTVETHSYNNNRNQRQPYRKPRWEIEQEERKAIQQKKAQEEEERQKNCELTDNNFPALGALKKEVRVWGGGKSFAALAVEWDEKAKKEEVEKKLQEVVVKPQPPPPQQQVVKHRQQMPLPVFENNHKFVDDDGMIEVTYKKYKREKTFEERIQQLEKKAEEEAKQDNSVWDNAATEEHESCWEDRY